MEHLLKSLLNVLQMLLLLYVSVFWLQGMWDFSSLNKESTKDSTSPAVGRQSQLLHCQGSPCQSLFELNKEALKKKENTILILKKTTKNLIDYGFAHSSTRGKRRW